MARLLAVGQPAPDVTLSDQDGKRVSLQALWRRGPLVVYFYPQDETPGCTKEACAFRDAYEVFSDAGATVVGISSDPVESHRRFAARHRLPFVLLADEQDEARAQFGVPRTLGLLGGRVTFVIDREGTVRKVFSSQLFAARHVTEALATVEGLKRGPRRNSGD
jgi:thioredoxin-dependent peroxiredoxin